MSRDNSNIIQFPSATPVLGELEQNNEPVSYYVAPKGHFPSGTVPAVTVRVDMAVGMYQFHDLLSRHEPYHVEGMDINDNGEIDLGFLNI